MKIEDKNGKEIKLEDYEAKEVVEVMISADGHRLWICVDGMAVLRVKAPQLVLDDRRDT